MGLNKKNMKKSHSKFSQVKKQGRDALCEAGYCDWTSPEGRKLKK